VPASFEAKRRVFDLMTEFYLSFENVYTAIEIRRDGVLAPLRMYRKRPETELYMGLTTVRDHRRG
jgi:hypothetical protein